MMEKAPSLFDAYYYRHNCGDPYERNDTWMALFTGVAQAIKREINPKTVLDAGCAKGFLVECLRKEGIAAFGVDVSEFAIQNAHESIRPYVWQGSISEPFKQRYDLIISIEVVEHMEKAEAEKAISNLCAFSDDILFSSTPFDFKEATHFNVQPPDYWIEQFARHGFYRDVDFDASFITAWAARLRRKSDPFHRIIRDYDRRFWFLNKENIDLRVQVNEMQAQIADMEKQLEGQVFDVDGKARELLAEIKGLQGQLDACQARWDDLQKGTAWRWLKRLQRLRQWLAPQDSARERMLNRLK